MGRQPFPPLGGTQDVFVPRSSVGDLPTIVAGEGVYLIDDRGRRLLDVCSGPFLANLGQGNERVLQAMLAQGRRLTYTYSRTTRHAANAEMEPVGGQASGVNVPHPSFARRARQICTRYGIHLVFDEIVSAFRTGRFLAAQHDPAAMPDVVVLAKGLAAGYAPLGAALVSAALAEEVAAATGFTVSHSYDASPIACAAGAAVLDEITGHRLIDRAAVLGTRLRDGLERIACASPLIGDVRGRGLLLALELVADKQTSRRFPGHADPAAIIRRHGLDHGLLLYSRRQNAGRYGDWLLIAPPLVIGEPTCDELLGRLETTLTAATPEVLDCGAG